MFHWKDIFCWTSVLCDTEEWLCWKQLIQKKWVWRLSKYIKSEGLIHVGHGLSVFLPLSSTSSLLDSWTPLDLSSLHFLKNLVVAKQKPVSYIFLSLDLELKWCERLNFTFRVLTGWELFLFAEIFYVREPRKKYCRSARITTKCFAYIWARANIHRYILFA